MSAPQVAFLPADHRKPRSLSATALSRPSKSNFALGSAIKTTTSNTSPSLTTANLIDKRTVEQQLIDNLRQQVAVLELENAQLKKERSVAWANTEPTHQHHHDEHGRPVSASAAGVRANLLQRIEALQAEVDGLRKAYARREQEHAVEMAEARNRMAENFRGSGFRSTGGQSGAGGLVSSDEVQQIRQQFEKDLNNAKDRYAQEVVHFEKTIDRLKAEAASHAAEHAAIQKEKEELTKELIIVKDAGRTSITNYEVLQRQYQEALHQLAQEQDRRRDVENKESDAKHRIADLQAQIAAYSAGKSTSELESKLKDVTARLNVVSFEFDKIRVTEAKMSADMQDMLKEKAERDVNDAIRSNEIEGLKTRLAQLEAKLTDVEAEREFFRLSTDRLKVENSVLAVKISQLEAKHNSDRASVLTLERQYAASLDTIEVLRRESKLKENVYKSLDEHDSTLRQQVYLAQEETNALRRANQDIREAFVDVSTKYDAIKDHADAIKAEQHLQAALQRLDRTKSEMHNLLQTQLKLSNDISAVIDDIPSDVSVHQHLHRSTLISGTSPVPPPHRTGGGGTTDMVEVSGVSAVPPPATIEVLSTITTTQ